MALFGMAVGVSKSAPSDRTRAEAVRLTVSKDRFGDFAAWAALNPQGVTIFAHADTWDDLAAHSDQVVWFGPSERVDLLIIRLMSLTPTGIG